MSAVKKVSLVPKVYIAHTVNLYYPSHVFDAFRGISQNWSR